MLKNIYSPLSGALAQERVLEMIANNLANLNTTGFKGDRVTFTLLEAEPEKNYQNPLPPANYKVGMEQLLWLKGNEMAYVGVADVQRDMQQGPSIQTHNELDLMIEGDGMFQVQTEDGPRYTRNGSFTLSPDGVLTTQSGHPVMGEKGDIVLRSGAFQVNDQGEIYQDKKLVDRLALYRVDGQADLEREGMNYYYYGGTDEGLKRVTQVNVRQGYLEGSNVNAIKDLTNMIIAHRSYEAYQKAVSNFDKMMDKSSNQLGNVRA